MVRLGIDRHAARIGVGDFAHRGQRIQIEDRDPGTGCGRTRDVQSPSVDIGVDIIEAARAADFDCLHQLVFLGEPGSRDQGDRRCQRYAKSHRKGPPHSTLSHRSI